MPEPVLKQLDGRFVFAGYKGPGCGDWIATMLMVAIQSPQPGLRIIVWSHDDECRTSNFRLFDQLWMTQHPSQCMVEACGLLLTRQEYCLAKRPRGLTLQPAGNTMLAN